MADEFDPFEYEFDTKPSDVVPLDYQERIAVIRTSDRISFRRCRRRWGWGSHLRGNLGTLETPAPLWMGVGFHYAMEDLHGLHEWPSAKDAFIAFATATYRKARNTLPANYDELTTLASGMLNYYERLWLPSRDPLKTFIFEGRHQVEVNFRIEVPWESGKYGYDRVIYSGTLDRVIIDEQGRLWLVDYKTAKSIFTMHFANDPQISAYCWAAEMLYPGYEIAGFIYQQHRKSLPTADGLHLANGKITTSRMFKTTRSFYKQALVNLYGDVLKAPSPNVDHLNWLASQEDTEKDLFIRRDRIYRNAHQNQSEGVKVLMEIDDMLNPDLPLYPSPTRDCVYMCPFHEPCVSMDDGSDWEYELKALTVDREGDYDLWRKYLPEPPNGGRAGELRLEAKRIQPAKQVEDQRVQKAGVPS